MVNKCTFIHENDKEEETFEYYTITDVAEYHKTIELIVGKDVIDIITSNTGIVGQAIISEDGTVHFSGVVTEWFYTASPFKKTPITLKFEDTDDLVFKGDHY